MEKRTIETIGIVLFFFLFIAPAIADLLMKIFPGYDDGVWSPLSIFLSLILLLLILFVDAMLRKSSAERKSLYFSIRLFFYAALICSGIIFFILRVLKKA